MFKVRLHGGAAEEENQKERSPQKEKKVRPPKQKKTDRGSNREKMGDTQSQTTRKNRIKATQEN